MIKAEIRLRLEAIEARLARIERWMESLAVERQVPEPHDQPEAPVPPPQIEAPGPSVPPVAPPPDLLHSRSLIDAEPTPADSEAQPSGWGRQAPDQETESETPPPAPINTHVLLSAEPTSARSVAPSLSMGEERPALVTSVLGWAGALAFVLAASYLIKLAIDAGWLTPARQVAMAAISGLLLIGAGLALRGFNRQYAGLLPAGGIVILFLSIYGGHLYYELIEMNATIAAVALVCVASLWLCRMFNSDLYALFAVVGSYSAPFLVASLQGSATDMVIYFVAWSAIFSAFAIWQGRRLIYLLALYLALTVFDILWRKQASGDWVPALVYQCAQFLIFGIATAVFSIRRKSPMDMATALAHLPALLLFYSLQYTLLRQNLPTLAPWIAIATLTAVVGLYGLARKTLARPLPGGELILWSYVALVLFHAGYLESIPSNWAPVMAILIVPAGALFLLRSRSPIASTWPVWLVIGVIFLINYLRLLFQHDIQAVPGHQWLPFIYAGLLYLGYHLVRDREKIAGAGVLLIHAGHISAMAGTSHLLDNQMLDATSWGLLALACLALGLWRRDGVLARSSFLIFASAGFRALTAYQIADPSTATNLSLVVLAATFYVAYTLGRRSQELGGFEAPLLFAGHISAMAAAALILQHPMVESTSWGLLALVCLSLALWRSDRLLAQSALLVFAVTAGKVLLLDLSGAQPLIRILSLVVLGATFYASGMLYQRLVRSAPE
jgi:uncharacterized membrane protein